MHKNPGCKHAPGLDRFCGGTFTVFLMACMLANLVAATSLSAADTRPSTSPSVTRIISKDGSLTLKLPGDWRESEAEAPAVICAFGNGVSAAGTIYLYCYNKLDYVSLDAVAKKEHKNVRKELKNVEFSGPRRVDIGDKKAICYDMTYDDDTNRWGGVAIYCDTANYYIEFRFTALRSKYLEFKDEWVKLAAGLTENPKPKKP